MPMVEVGRIPPEVERARARWSRYNHSEKGQARHRRYRESTQGQKNDRVQHLTRFLQRLKETT